MQNPRRCHNIASTHAQVYQRNIIHAQGLRTIFHTRDHTQHLLSAGRGRKYKIKGAGRDREYKIKVITS